MSKSITNTLASKARPHSAPGQFSAHALIAASSVVASLKPCEVNGSFLPLHGNIFQPRFAARNPASNRFSPPFSNNRSAALWALPAPQFTVVCWRWFRSPPSDTPLTPVVSPAGGFSFLYPLVVSCGDGFVVAQRARLHPLVHLRLEPHGFVLRNDPRTRKLPRADPRPERRARDRNPSKHLGLA